MMNCVPFSLGGKSYKPKNIQNKQCTCLACVCGFCFNLFSLFNKERKKKYSMNKPTISQQKASSKTNKGKQFADFVHLWSPFSLFSMT
jgi:hypothetical protein